MKFLPPRGLPMDDLEWTYEQNPADPAPMRDGRPLGPLSAAERTEPSSSSPSSATTDPLKQHPRPFTRFVREDAG